jgi:hypothetical protein
LFIYLFIYIYLFILFIHSFIYLFIYHKRTKRFGAEDSLTTAKQEVASDVVIGKESLLFDLIHRVSYFEAHSFYPRDSFTVQETNKEEKKKKIKIRQKETKSQ